MVSMVTRCVERRGYQHGVKHDRTVMPDMLRQLTIIVSSFVSQRLTMRFLI